MLFSIVTINKPATVIIVSLEVKVKHFFLFIWILFKIVFFVFSTLHCTLI